VFIYNQPNTSAIATALPAVATLEVPSKSCVAVAIPVMFTSPTTSSLDAGILELMPTLPLESIRSAVPTPPIPNDTVEP
jgi:hypothetical protein